MLTKREVDAAKAALRLKRDLRYPSDRDLAMTVKRGNFGIVPQDVYLFAGTVADDSEAQRQYMAGACDAYTTDASGLAASRATMPDAENHIILPEIISKEPLGPVVRHGDNNWGDIVRWTYYALLIAEEKGITKANVAEVAASTNDEEVKRLLGLADSGDLPAKLGLPNEAFKNAIAAVGNYGEIFAANIGEGTAINLARGLNALWTQGGLQYAPPFR